MLVHLCVDLAAFGVIPLSQNVNGWELRKIVKDLSQPRKEILIFFTFHSLTTQAWIFQKIFLLETTG